jgi:hypothetical protein
MRGRHPDWRARLNGFLAANETRPFAWDGVWDCCIGLMAGAVEAVKADAPDYAAPYRGKYRSKTGAFKALRKIDGVKTPAELMTKWFGGMRPAAFARTGDLVIYQGCIGVMHGAEGVFIGCEMLGDHDTHEGLVRVPRAELEGCWHV